MANRTINNIIEFEELMIEIDTILKEKDITIPNRSIQALLEAGSLLEIEDMKVFPFKSNPIEGVYEGDSLLAHISKWIDGRYGDRLKLDPSLGQCLIIIRGDPWLLNYPFIFGHIRFICERDLTKKFVVNKSGKPQKKPEINLLKLIENLPQPLANELTDDELQTLLDHFINFLDLFTKTRDHYKNEELINSGLIDLKESAVYCVRGRVSYHLSKWASLQAAEKFLKFYLDQKNVAFPYIHNLEELAQQAYRNGLPTINQDIINDVQCEARVRYETSTDSTNDVVKAHLGALEIGLLVIKTLTV